MTATTPQTEKRGFTLTRTLDATPEEVFRAWTDPAHMGWYFNDTMPIPDEPIEVDLRPGGYWRQMMVIDEGTRFVTGGMYLEIDPPDRLVFAMGATDGWPALDPHKLSENPVVTVTLMRIGRRTAMSVDVRLPEGMSEERARRMLESNVRQGWSDTIDRLVQRCTRD
jgi:uncharacterized protein YndB with AHSA1/START domain